MGTSDVGKGGSAVLVVGVGGCSGGSAEITALANGKSLALAFGQGGCRRSRLECRGSVTAALRRLWSVWAGARWAMWAWRRVARAALRL